MINILDNIRIKNTKSNLILNKNFRRFLGLSSIFCGFMIIREEYLKYKSFKLIELKKERLSMPIYELKDDELVNFPWNFDNIDEWLYRPIKINGRETHRFEFLIPRKLNFYKGFDIIIPLVTKETYDLEDRQGILLNLGWIPHQKKKIESRPELPNTLIKKDFIGYVTDSEDLKNNNFFKSGNCYDEQRFIWNHFYLPDMVRASQLKNDKQAKVAIIEQIDYNYTKLDEKDPRHYNVDMTGTNKLPHLKTLSGALQNKNMPWDHQLHQKYYFGYSILSMGLFLLSKVH